MTPPGGSRDDDDRDPQLRAMRAVWVAMRDEDPPDRGLADLLAAARHQAAAARPRPSAWQRLLAALRRPPVLAFATVTVLIAGAVLIGLRPPHAAAPAAVSAIGTHEARPADPPVPAGLTASPAHAPANQPPAEGTAAAPRPGASSEAPAAAASDPASDAHRAVDPATAPIATGAPAPDRRHASAASSDAGDDLVRRSETAAQRGDCATVRRLVDQILQIDPGYRARVASGSPVARCLAP